MRENSIADKMREKVLLSQDSCEKINKYSTLLFHGYAILKNHSEMKKWKTMFTIFNPKLKTDKYINDILTSDSIDQCQKTLIREILKNDKLPSPVGDMLFKMTTVCISFDIFNGLKNELIKE